jgi:hypothetical protein
MYPQLAPRIFYDPEQAYGNFHVRIALPEDYYEIVPEMDKDRVAKMMEIHLENLGRFYRCMEPSEESEKNGPAGRINVAWKWDEKRGLYWAEIHTPFYSPSMFLEAGDFEYQTHNLTSPVDALVIAMVGLDYLDYVNSVGQQNRMEKKPKASTARSASKRNS